MLWCVLIASQSTREGYGGSVHVSSGESRGGRGGGGRSGGRGGRRTRGPPGYVCIVL